MLHHKRSIENQQYEEYWQLTLEYSNCLGYGFNKTLDLIVKYIDCYKGNITSKIYQDMQNDLNELTPKKDLASIRKAINQFFKLGFINNRFASYHPKTKSFLNERDNSRKKRIYSEILYDNASFKRSFSNPSYKRELNFLINTLEYCGSLSKEDLTVLMYQDIEVYQKGYLTLDEIEYLKKQMDMELIMKRKYNQINFLWGICVNILTGIYINIYQKITLDRDEQVHSILKQMGRDPYKQRLYKHDLYNEAININGKIACYYEDISYPILIASHIKPYSQCSEYEKFDVDNGLLLSKDMDQLFDNGWITFDNDGTVICAFNLDNHLKKRLENKKLNFKYLTSYKRLIYLDYHRNNVFNINKKYSYFKNK